jgi:hypothetical protein
MRNINLVGYRTGLAKTSLLMLAVATAGCGGDFRDAEAESTGVAAEAIGTSGLRACHGPGAVAGGGWQNFAVPETTAATGAFTVQFSAYPNGENGTLPTIDGVIGFSDGPADAFMDLGPIVQFNLDGGIALRNGDHYEQGSSYRTGIGGFEIQLLIDVGLHQYSGWVRNFNGLNKPFEVMGTNLAFRTQQANVTRLNNIGVFVDSASGELQAPCALSYSSPTACASSGPGVWKSQPFAAQTGVFRLEFIATPSTADIDAVVGATQGTADAFSDLAAIVRFRPDGTIDARNGGAYSAEATARYYAGRPYWVALDIDRPNGTYSATVAAGYDAPVVIAQDYAFRTEQSSISAFDSVAQFVDQTAGSLQVCMLTLVQ